MSFYKTGSTKATTETPPIVKVPEFLANVRRLTRDLFNQYRDRPELDRIHGTVWDPKQLADEFEVPGFTPRLFMSGAGTTGRWGRCSSRMNLACTSATRRTDCLKSVLLMD